MGKEVLELLLQFPALEASQASYVFCRWAVTTWPSSLGWPSAPAGATLEGHLDQLLDSPDPLERPAGATRTDYLATALSGFDGPLDTTTRLSLFWWTASCVNQKLTFATQSLAHRVTQASRHEGPVTKLCLVTGPVVTQSSTVEKTLLPWWNWELGRLSRRLHCATVWAEPAWSTLWGWLGKWRHVAYSLSSYACHCCHCITQQLCSTPQVRAAQNKQLLTQGHNR